MGHPRPGRAVLNATAIDFQITARSVEGDTGRAGDLNAFLRADEAQYLLRDGLDVIALGLHPDLSLGSNEAQAALASE
ncbi:hypothetical protein D9M70_548410 [compost metagenome]